MADIQGVHSVEIAASILEAIAEQGRPLRASEIAKISGLSKSRLHKYLVSLCRASVLYQDPGNSLYSLGYRLVVLGRAAEKQNDWLPAIEKALSQLRDKLNISTGLVVKKGDRVSLIQYNRSNKNIEIDYRTNTMVPLTESASGKVFAAFGGDNASLTDDERKQILRFGYAIRLDEVTGISGAKAIACPVFNSSCQLVGAAVIMGFLPDSQDELDRLAQELIDKVKSVE